ncbi:exopolysaccharide biosynthesis protein [Paracoccus seriniphilus]|uniref:exopolysaccharide biosynthesis protein n=1 Tax=Paracoccus seriniphilus TaxID=184748 RepID=UPI0035627533
MPEQESVLTSVVDDLQKCARDTPGSKVPAGDLLATLGHRGYGAALAILPLIELSPIGGVPGFPTMLAVVLAVLTLRLLLGYRSFWVPNWLRRRELRSDRVIRSVEWLRPLSQRIDAKLHERLSRFAGPAGRRAAGCVILGLLLTVPPLEIVPLASSAPMIVIAIFGLGMLFNDGLLMLLGFIGAIIAVLGGLSFLI